MRKNSKKNVDLNYEIKLTGNWNYKRENVPVNTKPIAVINIDGDEFVWRHEEIFKLIKAYYLADSTAIEMILSGLDTGSIKNYETPFLVKLNQFIIELKKEGNTMDIKDFVKQQGAFLKAETIVNNPEAEFTISEEPVIVHNKTFDKDRLHIPLKFQEVEFTFDCSKSNARIIAGVIGEESTTWVGKKLTFETYKMMGTDNKMRDAIKVKGVI